MCGQDSELAFILTTICRIECGRFRLARFKSILLFDIEVDIAAVRLRVEE